MIGKAGERQAVRLESVAVAGKLGCTRDIAASTCCSVWNHVHVPVEEQIDFRRAAAGDGAHRCKPGNAVDRFFDRTRDGDHHLVDRHHAVIDADDDAREIGRRENRDRNGERQICSSDRQDENQEDSDLATRVPVALVTPVLGSATSATTM